MTASLVTKEPLATSANINTGNLQQQQNRSKPFECRIIPIKMAEITDVTKLPAEEGMII